MDKFNDKFDGTVLPQNDNKCHNYDEGSVSDYCATEQGKTYVPEGFTKDCSNLQP